jgi:hypothetical protein
LLDIEARHPDGRCAHQQADGLGGGPRAHRAMHPRGAPSLVRD